MKIGSTGRFAIAGLFSLTAFAAGAGACPQIQRIWATQPEKIEAAMASYPDAFKDGIILATFAGLKIGSEEVRDFATQKAFVERMKAHGKEVVVIPRTEGISSSLLREFINIK